MTREELAKKRGLKAPKPVKSASESLLTHVNETVDSSIKDINTTEDAEDTSTKTPKDTPVEPEITETITTQVIEPSSKAEGNDSKEIVNTKDKKDENNDEIKEKKTDSKKKKTAKKPAHSKKNKVNLMAERMDTPLLTKKTTSLRLTASISSRFVDLAIDKGYRYKATYLDALISAHKELFEKGEEDIPVKFKPEFPEKYSQQTSITISQSNYEWLIGEHFRATRINITDYLNYILYLEMDDLGTDYLLNG